MIERISSDEMFSEIARVVAKRSTCPKLGVGAVVVDRDGFVVSTGYNGSPRGIPHCTDVGCLIDPTTGRCKRAVHAELNAIIQAGLSRCVGGVLYLTHYPCPECMTTILNCQFSRVVSVEDYDWKAVPRNWWESGI